MKSSLILVPMFVFITNVNAWEWQSIKEDMPYEQLTKAIGVFFVAISILAGILLSLSRLYDLRITAHIILTRKRSIKEGIILKDEKLTENRFLICIRSLLALALCFKYPDYEIRRDHIKEKTIEALTALQASFTKAQQLSDDLGNSTWGLMNCQTISFFVSILFFIWVLIIK